MRTFVSELRRRNVLRVAAAYALVAWIIIEAGSVLLPTFGASEDAFQLYVIAVLVGFLIALIFAWIFEITPEGVVVDRAGSRSDAPKKPPKALTNYLIIGLLILALGVSITFNVTGVRQQNATLAADMMMDRRAIAVLPFTSRSTDPENALFADGIHDDLLTKLANIGEFRVISRTSVMEYRDTTKNLRDIGKELGVDTLLEGAVQRVGDSVRINVQLIDAESDDHLWANTYDRELSMQNIFAIQSEIASAISSALQTALLPQDEVQLANIPTENIRAYSLYTSGRDNLYLRRLEPLQKAREQFAQAIELDPKYAEAYVGLAEAIILLRINHLAISQEEAWELAEQHIERAVELNPDLSDAYAALGLLRTSQWATTRIGDMNLEAEAAFEQAIALNPNNADAYMWFASLRDNEQRPEDAIAYYHRSMQLDPLARVPYANLAALYAQQGANEYALKLWLQAIEIHPDWPAPYQFIALHLAGMGRLDESLAWGHTAKQLSTEAEALFNIGIGIYSRFGDIDRAKAMLADIPDTHPMSAVRQGFELLIDDDLESALSFFTALIESDTPPPNFVIGVASDIALVLGKLDIARKFTLQQNPVLTVDAELPIDRFTVRDVIKLGFIDLHTGNATRGRQRLDAALPVVLSLPRLGMFGHGIRDAQIYGALGRIDDAFAAIRAAIEQGFRSAIFYNFWTLRDDPYLAGLRDDARFGAILDELDALVETMRLNVDAAEKNNDWESLTSLVAM